MAKIEEHTRVLELSAIEIAFIRIGLQEIYHLYDDLIEEDYLEEFIRLKDNFGMLCKEFKLPKKVFTEPIDNCDDL